MGIRLIFLLNQFKANSKFQFITDWNYNIAQKINNNELKVGLIFMIYYI
jgi:hypothetical protein